MNLNKIVNFFFELASMRRIIRAHSQFIRETDDNISDHSFRVAIIGMNLARLEECDADKVLKMSLFHDVVETRVGDANFINKLYSDLHKEEAHKDQMEDLPIGGEISELLKEFEQRESKEAVVATDADYLDQMILQREYFFKDPQNHEIWQNYTQLMLKSESAKKLAQEIRKTNPFEWLYQIAEQRTGKKVPR